MYAFEDGFTEEDELWKPDERETKAHVAQRAASVFDRIFLQDPETCEDGLGLYGGVRDADRVCPKICASQRIAASSTGSWLAWVGQVTRFLLEVSVNCLNSLRTKESSHK